MLSILSLVLSYLTHAHDQLTQHKVERIAGEGGDQFDLLNGIYKELLTATCVMYEPHPFWEFRDTMDL